MQHIFVGITVSSSVIIIFFWCR